MRFVEFCNKTVTKLLLRDYNTSTNKRSIRLVSRDYSTPARKHNKMIEYLNFVSPMQFSHLNLLPVRLNEKIYHSLKKMAEAKIDNLMSCGYDAPQSDSKRHKLLECILTGNSKLYLGKVYTEEQINKLSDEEVDKLFDNYKAKLSGQMVKSLGISIINLYLMRAYAAVRISNQDALSETLRTTLS